MEKKETKVSQLFYNTENTAQLKLLILSKEILKKNSWANFLGGNQEF